MIYVMSKVILLIGMSGCGKTTFTKKFLPKLIKISLDQIKDRKKEYSVIEQNLANNIDFVVDDTNITKKSRLAVISICKKYNAYISAIFFNFNVERCISQNSKRKNPISNGAIYKMNKDLETPVEDEGFNFIQTVNNDFRF